MICKCNKWWNIQLTFGICCGPLSQHPCLLQNTRHIYWFHLPIQLTRKNQKIQKWGSTPNKSYHTALAYVHRAQGLEVDLEPSPKRGSHKINKLKQGRKTPEYPDLAFFIFTFFTYFFIFFTFVFFYLHICTFPYLYIFIFSYFHNYIFSCFHTFVFFIFLYFLFFIVWVIIYYCNVCMVFFCACILSYLLWRVSDERKGMLTQWPAPDPMG